MALVSISEASRLTNKSRTTVHRYISKGKLSICTDENGVKKIDTSELLRVFGAFKAVHHEQIDNVTSRLPPLSELIPLAAAERPSAASQ